MTQSVRVHFQPDLARLGRSHGNVFNAKVVHTAGDGSFAGDGVKKCESSQPRYMPAVPHSGHNPAGDVAILLDMNYLNL